MDLNVGKRNLIILLIILNIFLIISIYRHNNNVSVDNPYFSSESIENFNKLLDSRGISLDAAIPKDYENMGMIDFEYEVINSKTYPQLFDEFKEIDSSNNFKKAVIKMSYDDILIKRRAYNLNYEEDKLDFTQEFLSLYFGNKKFDLKLKTDNLIYYNPIFNNVIYEESYIKFNFDEEAILIDILLMFPQETVIARRNVITPIEAILTLIPELKSGDVIKRIDLIYYFEPNEEELYKVKNARALPSWRIITQDNDVLYAFALKGVI